MLAMYTAEHTHWQSPRPVDTASKQYTRPGLSTMETLGVQLQPQEFRPQDINDATTTTATTNAATITAYQQQWGHEMVPYVQVTSPGMANQLSAQSHDQSSSADYLQFQSDYEHFEKHGLPYTPPSTSGSGGYDGKPLENIDESSGAGSQISPYQYILPSSRDEHSLAVPDTMRVPVLDSESMVYPMDYNNNIILQDHQHSSASSLGATPFYNLPYYYHDSVLGDFPMPDSGEFSVPSPVPSHHIPVQGPDFDIDKNYRQFQESHPHYHNDNKHWATAAPAPAAQNADNAKNSWPSRLYVLKSSRKPPTPPSTKSPNNRVQKQYSQPRHPHGRSGLSLQSTNEILMNLVNNSPTMLHNSKPLQQQYHQQQHQILHQAVPPVPALLLPSNVDTDSDTVSVQTSHSSQIQIPAQMSLQESINNDDSGETPKITISGAVPTPTPTPPIENQHTNISRRPPNLLAPLLERPSSPPATDMNPNNPELIPHKQKLRSDHDLYTPRWVRGHGNKREGWCGICKPGRWLVLKNSAFWYDKCFSHGVSAVTGTPFAAPKEIRKVKRIKIKESDNDSSNSNNNPSEDAADGTEDAQDSNNYKPPSSTNGHTRNRSTTAWEGLCDSCNEWIPLVSSKKKGTTWFRHAYKCQGQFKNRERGGMVLIPQ